MNLGSLLPRRRSVRNAETEIWPALPDASLSVTDKLAALGPDPVPSFTPNPGHVRRHAQQSPEILRRVRDGLRAMPGPSRVDLFAADMRMARRGGLPLFRATVATFGFCGLDEDRQRGGAL